MTIIIYHGGSIIMENNEIKPIIMQCRYCGNKTVFKLQGSYYQSDYFTLKTGNDTGEFSIWKFWACATCEKPTIERIDKASSFYTTYSEEEGPEEHEDVFSDRIVGSYQLRNAGPYSRLPRFC